MGHLVVYYLFALVASTLGVECPAAPTLDAEWRLFTSLPSQCNRFACDLYIGIRTNQNPDFLDFVMEGKAKGWIAVGFTPSPSMPDADVFACVVNADKNPIVTVLDTYNPTYNYINQMDSIQDVCVHATNYTDGRISCLFSRAIRTSDKQQDKDLDQKYYELFGAVDFKVKDPNISLSYHRAQNPYISNFEVNPATSRGPVSGSGGILGCLTRVHGILMIIAWPMMGATAIFFASWMRPALPVGVALLLHRAFAAASLAIGLFGFTLIFVANKDQPLEGLIALENRPNASAHVWLGVIVMALHVLNPIIAIFKCKYSSSRRWIYGLVHGIIVGLGGFLLAMVDIASGLLLFDKFSLLASTSTIFAVFMVYVGLLLFLNVTLFVLFTYRALKTKHEGGSVTAPFLLKYFIGDSRHAVRKHSILMLTNEYVDFDMMLQENSSKKDENISGPSEQKETTFCEKSGQDEGAINEPHKSESEKEHGSEGDLDDNEGNVKGHHSPNDNIEPQNKKWSDYFTDTNVRSGAFAFFIVTMVPLMVVIIVMISI